MCKVIAIANMAGGSAKTTTTVNLGMELARAGKRVLLIDADPKCSLTTYMGCKEDDSSITLYDILCKTMQENFHEWDKGILRHEEDVGLDFIPATVNLSRAETFLAKALSRETILRQYLENLKPCYDYVLIDCSPSIGILTVNALSAADSVLIPVEVLWLSAVSSEPLIQCILSVKKLVNSDLTIEGILLTKRNCRTEHAEKNRKGD